MYRTKPHSELLERRVLLSGSLLISGDVFEDRNANGMDDSGDQPIPGAIVYADLNHDGAMQPAEPQAKVELTGSYRLSLAPGSYAIRVSLPSAYRLSLPSDGSYEA